MTLTRMAVVLGTIVGAVLLMTVALRDADWQRSRFPIQRVIGFDSDSLMRCAAAAR